MPNFDYVTVRDQIFTDISGQLSATTNVYKYPIGDQELKKNTTDDTYEALWLSELRVDRVQETYRQVKDTVEVSGTILVESPGAGDDQASNAETRAQTILTAVETGLQTDDELGGNALAVWITDVTSQNGATERGRSCQVEFILTVESFNA